MKDPTYLVSLKLRDGSWLNVTAAYAETIEFWPIKAIIFLGAAVATIAALSIWAIRGLTAPFRVFASAAARLGTDVNAPPIKMRGPLEVQGAIHAFNGMQRKLQRFLEDRTLMLAGVSHDLRTPITRLKLRAEFVKRRGPASEGNCGPNEMERMIVGFLAFAKDDHSVDTTTTADLVSILQSICDEMSDDGLSVSFDGTRRIPLLCRPDSLRRCFFNVIDNAVRYGNRAIVHLEIKGDEVSVLVDDFGPGIAEELQDAVFRPFFRVDASRNAESGGSGLGLSVARTIARAHGGDISLQNRAGGGLRIKIVLPKNVADTESFQHAAE